MKFAHLADIHLGSWRQPELQALNLESFGKAIDICIKEKVAFVLIAGDLFDSAYPPIEILEETFKQLKRLKDSNIPCYIIAGSHDYSVSGKTFLNVLEKAGFCENIHKEEEKDGKIFLNPVVYKNIALYGYPGKKSGLEIKELKRIKLQDSPGMFKILALHTCIENAVGNLPVEFIREEELPKADYYALGHLHIDYSKDNFVYAGPIFPANFQELEELNYGSFYLVETEPLNYKKVEIKLKNVEVLDLEISSSLGAVEKIIQELKKRNLEDKIILLRISGKLKQGKIADIDFKLIEDFCKEKKAYALLKSTSKLIPEEPEAEVEIEDIDKLEEEIIKKYTSSNTTKFDSFIFPLINSLSLEKQEEETSSAFQSRLFSELNKTLNLSEEK